jgi:hypothetical protein
MLRFVIGLAQVSLALLLLFFEAFLKRLWKWDLLHLSRVFCAHSLA